MYFSLYMMISIGFLSAIQPFIQIWIGNEFLLSYSIVILIMVNCYISGMKQPLEIFISADGLFQKLSVEPWITAALNLFFSVVMGKQNGILGVILGTTISQLLTDVWYYGYIVFKYSFNQKFICYIETYIKNIVVVVVACVFMIWGDMYLFSDLCLIGQLSANIFFSLVIFVVTWMLFFHKTEEYIYFQKLILKIISTRK